MEQLKAAKPVPKLIQEVLAAETAGELAEVLITMPSKHRKELAKSLKILLGNKKAKLVRLSGFDPQTETVWESPDIDRVVAEFREYLTAASPGTGSVPEDRGVIQRAYRGPLSSLSGGPSVGSGERARASVGTENSARQVRINHHMSQIGTILDQIDLGSMALPEFQRAATYGTANRFRGLMHSLYRKHPVGGLLVWVTKSEQAAARGDGSLQPGTVKLLLDGQQRITSLYGIIRGKPPKFFDGNGEAFTGLYFNLGEEAFEFYAPLKMKDDPLWISVTDLMKVGVGVFVQRLLAAPETAAQLTTYINRLNAIEGIKHIDLHIEEVTGQDKTVDVVVDIFNQVNSGGTKLSKGDLALAKICAEWSPARGEMKKLLAKWSNVGFSFDLDWLLRNVNAILRNESRFDAMKDVSTAEFQDGLKAAERTTDTLLNLVASRLGLDHGDVLGSRYAFPVMARYIAQKGYKITNYKDRDKLLYWYLQTLLWGRYASSTESTMRQDLTQLDPLDQALDKLIALLRQSRGDLKLQQGTSLAGARAPALPVALSAY